MLNILLLVVTPDPPQAAVTMEIAQVGETTGEVHKMMAFSFVNEWSLSLISAMLLQRPLPHLYIPYDILHRSDQRDAVISFNLN